MATELIVRSPFGTYVAGATITDPTAIATILAGPNAGNVIQVTNVNSSGATISAPILAGFVAEGTTTVSGSFSGGTPSGLTYSIDGGTAQTASSPMIGTSTYSFSITTPLAGTHTIAVQGTGGNTATSSTTTFVTIATSGGVVSVTGAPATPSDSSGTITIDASALGGSIVNLTGTGRTVAALANRSAGRSGVIEFVQGSGGGNTITTWDSTFDFGSAGAPVLSTAAGARDIVSWWDDGTKVISVFKAGF